MARRCLEFGCGRFIRVGSRCEVHRVAHERARGRQRGQRRSGYSRTAWASAVKRRDGWRCRVIGCQTPHDRVQAHHRIALVNGGPDTLENGITLCHAHHMAAHQGDYRESGAKAG